MSVHIACEKCGNRLVIPETVVGGAIKCPGCGSAFKATLENVLPDKAAAGPPAESAPAAPEVDEYIVPAGNHPVVIPQDDEAEDRPAPGNKAATADGKDEIVAVKKKPAAADGEAVPVRRKEAAERVEEGPKQGKRRTPWYVMLPLLLLSLSAAGLAALWTIGFSYLDMDRGLRHLEFETKVWIGVGSAGAVTLLCLIFSLVPARAWLRFLLVLFFLGVGYGGSFAAIHWWNSLPVVPDEPVENPYLRPKPNPGGGGPPQGPGGGRGAMPPPGGRGPAD
jgi:hypothetical protein